MSELTGFNVALDLAHRGEDGSFRYQNQEKIFNEIMDIKIMLFPSCCALWPAWNRIRRNYRLNC